MTPTTADTRLHGHGRADATATPAPMASHVDFSPMRAFRNARDLSKV
jgi:hypothetical protein